MCKALEGVFFASLQSLCRPLYTDARMVLYKKWEFFWILDHLVRALEKGILAIKQLPVSEKLCYNTHINHRLRFI